VIITLGTGVFVSESPRVLLLRTYKEEDSPSLPHYVRSVESSSGSRLSQVLTNLREHEKDFPS